MWQTVSVGPLGRLLLLFFVGLDNDESHASGACCLLKLWLSRI